MRAAWLALLLVLPVATGCLGGDQAQAYARDHIGAVTGLEVRMANTTYTLDPSAEPGRPLAMAALEALYHVEGVHQQTFAGQGVAPSLQDGGWLRLQLAPGTEVALPNADGVNGTVQPEDVYVIWESDELDGNLALDGERIQAEYTTSASEQQIRDLAVEALHQAGKTPGPG